MRHLLLLTLVIAGLAIPVTSLAQQRAPQEIDPFVARHRQKQSEDAPEITFTIRLKDNQVRFQQGEIIRLELLFSSSMASRFTLNMGFYERGGRVAIDEFIVDRERSAVDALSDYYNSLSGLMGGGSGGFRQLRDEPITAITELNEWRRIDKIPALPRI